MRNNMDYIYTSGEQKILIEVEQKSTGKAVVEQYVQCRKMQGLTQAEMGRTLQMQLVAKTQNIDYL